MRQSEVGGLPPHSLPPPHLGASKPQFPLLDNAGGQRPAIEAQNAVEGLASGGTRPQRGTALARTIETHGVRAGPRARWARPRRRCPRLPLRASQACVPPCLPLHLSPSGRPSRLVTRVAGQLQERSGAGRLGPAQVLSPRPRQQSTRVSVEPQRPRT